MGSPGDLLSAAQAGEILGISRRRVAQLAAEGYLRGATTISRTLVIPRAEVERLAREGWPGRRRVSGSG
jgi:hypothetical protein